MRLHLDHIPQKPDFRLDHSQSSFLIGSCFSTNIHSYLIHYKFNTFSNPHGILFNPLSIADSLNQIIELKETNKKFLLQRGEQFFSYKLHSSIYAGSKNELLEKLGLENKTSHEFLKKANYLFITFGSAFYYHHTQLNAPVANCHKQPASEFEKRLLTVSEIVNEYTFLLTTLKKLNKTLKIIFTVSPVKHLKDGLVENNISKSVLILAVHELISKNVNCYYFPAYELINDDLRDYRFYKEDMAHPNQQAIDYVWQKFSNCFFDIKTVDLNKQIHKLQLALNHRQINGNELENEKLKAFIEEQKKEILKLDPKISL